MTNPNRLYETERKRQQRARIAAGQVHKVVLWLNQAEMDALLEIGNTPPETISRLIKSHGHIKTERA